MTPGSTSANGLALDARSLDALRRNAAGDPRAALKQAAGQFEALFLQQLLKSMRDAMPKSGMFDGPGQETYVAMLDQQLSQSMANRPGSLAEIIAKQLERNLPASAAAKTDAASIGTNPANTALRAARKEAPTTLSLDPAASRALKESLGKRLDAPQAAFVDRMWPHAIAAQRTTGVPAAFVVGQAALESGWGRREIRHDDGRSAHNLFGIKATGGWHGPAVDVTTTEYVDGKPVKAVEKFRAYGSYAEAFRDWASLMSTSARYGGVLRDARSPEGFAQGLQRAGYATDPDYADKLESTIQRALRLARSGV
ncbi:MAG: flagellar assembly peptidoglycan hydrolase FlgJ [Burkholderiaceae bacterium]|jgi:flagellar protein FlgJ|nr:flagellar assembly peptidoglycan hydrolase FlgJ [Burkholderiaceae bacterium]